MASDPEEVKRELHSLEWKSAQEIRCRIVVDREVLPAQEKAVNVVRLSNVPLLS